jgi:hypothetical protein
MLSKCDDLRCTHACTHAQRVQCVQHTNGIKPSGFLASLTVSHKLNRNGSKLMLLCCKSSVLIWFAYLVTISGTAPSCAWRRLTVPPRVPEIFVKNSCADDVCRFRRASANGDSFSSSTRLILAEFCNRIAIALVLPCSHA